MSARLVVSVAVTEFLLRCPQPSDGKTMPMDKDMTLTDGSKVMMGGSVAHGP